VHEQEALSRSRRVAKHASAMVAADHSLVAEAVAAASNARDANAVTRTASSG
jgi:hypothetical protein